MSRLTLAKLLVLAAAGISWVLSVGRWFGGPKDQGEFVGLRVPTVLALGALTPAGRGNR